MRGMEGRHLFLSDKIKITESFENERVEVEKYYRAVDMATESVQDRFKYVVFSRKAYWIFT